MLRICLSYDLRTAADHIGRSVIAFWDTKLGEGYGIKTVLNPDVTDGENILRQCHNILTIMPRDLVKACGINTLNIRNDMGPNKPYFPNHGYFVDHSVTLNADLFYHPDMPDDFVDHHGYFISRPAQTLYHEFGHGYDEYNDHPSLDPKWLKLSGWSETYQPGLRRQIIRDKECPERVGEWFYDPQAEFTRFYARQNPWDDFADSFAFYTGGLKAKVPENKRKHLDTLLTRFYS